MTNRAIYSFECSACKKTFKLSNPQAKIVCPCGNQSIEAVQRKDQTIAPCIHRGIQLRDLDCKCAGKPKIYECGIHGECLTRPVHHTKARPYKVCQKCSDQKMYRKSILGMIYTCFHDVGGAETFARSLFMNVHEHVTGLAVMTEPVGSCAELPMYRGQDAANELCRSSDIVLCWGFLEGLREAFEANTGCRLVAIHHGSMASSWANDIFKQQLEILGDGIAVDRDVAWHFGVPYLPNPVVDHGIRRVPRTQGPRKILWNHRWSGEKRPELALEIAKKLPSGYEILISAPKHAALPMNCTNIGQKIDNTALLADSDIFLSTASQEAFGYSIAEAVLARVPVVCGPYGIGNEVATQIVDSDNPKAWVNAIIETDDRFTESAAQWLDTHHGDGAVVAWKKFLEIV